jgi:hypothetical protein
MKASQRHCEERFCSSLLFILRDWHPWRHDTLRAGSRSSVGCKGVVSLMALFLPLSTALAHKDFNPIRFK